MTWAPTFRIQFKFIGVHVLGKVIDYLRLERMQLALQLHQPGLIDRLGSMGMGSQRDVFRTLGGLKSVGTDYLIDLTFSVQLIISDLIKQSDEYFVFLTVNFGQLNGHQLAPF
ncbi:MAG: hypothetical protein IPO25_19855 [Saprospiraceae bacterium]|nr:hypothetical protein [Saprospiraceae bacterium]